MSLPPACPSMTEFVYDATRFLVRCWLCWPTYIRSNPPKRGLVPEDDDLGLCPDCIAVLAG